MLVFSGLVPHNPLLLRPDLATCQPVLTGLEQFATALEKSAPDTVLIISDHASHFDKQFSVYFSDQLTADFKEFGILKELFFKPDVALISRLLSAARHKKIALQQVASAHLDYGSAITLKNLNVQSKKIIVIGPNKKSLLDQVNFGSWLREIIENYNERVAVIISSDLAHQHTSDSPEGFSPGAKVFDESILKILEHRSLAGLTAATTQRGSELNCLSRPLALGFGILRGIPNRSQVLSYHVCHGVGLLTALLFY